MNITERCIQCMTGSARWPNLLKYWVGDFGKVLLNGLVACACIQLATASRLDAQAPPKAKENLSQPEKNQQPSPATTKKSVTGPADAKPKAPSTPPKQSPANVPPAPTAKNPANPVLAPPPAAPPSFGQLDAGQGQLLSRASVPGFFGDLFQPGGTVLNVPGTPIHNTPQNPNATPLALGFGSVSVAGTPSPEQIYFRSVTAGPIPPIPFLLAPGTESYVYKTNSSGIDKSTSPPTYQLQTIPPQSTNPAAIVGYYLPITATQVSPSQPFAGDLNQLKSAPPTIVDGHPVNDVIAVGAPITNIGGTPATVNMIFGIFPDTAGPNYAAQPLVFDGPTQVPILFVLTSNTSPSVYSPSVAAGGVQKLVDNASPLPRDRVFFNYSYFENTSIQVDGRAIDVNRIVPGFEKTFFNQRMSIEVRVPFATTIDDVNLTGTTNTGNIMLGNQTTYLKAILFSDSKLAVSAGLGVQAPTASSTSYSVNGYAITASGQYTQKESIEVLKISNQAVHLLPYLGAVYTPNDRFYAQSVAQLDLATNGNTVYNAAVYPVLNSSDPNTANWTVTSGTTGLSRAGSLDDTNFMYLSANAGYWLYQVKNRYERGLTGFSPTIELHYNQSLQRGDSIGGFYGNPGNGVGSISQLNGVIGTNAVFGFDKFLSVAYVAPFGTGVNRAFDGELRVMFNYYFGKSRVNPRFNNIPSM